ncbi:MAG: HD domain-containing protein [Nitrospirae bacterium]|nr:MAG: HD domain-containing protein [Nitrospirota bacterium]
MTAKSNSSLSAFKFFSQLCGLVTAALGIIAIAGWLTGWRILTAIRANYIPMAPNTALSFIILGIALYALVTERKPALKLSRIGVGVILVLSLIRLMELSADINLNVDRWIFQVPEDKLGLIPIGKMALPTALNFLFASVAILLAPFLRRRLVCYALTRIFAGLTTFIGLVFCLGYIFDAPLLYGGTTIPMALNTAIAFFVLGLGLVINNLSHDIAERKQAQEAVKKAYAELEARVAERTSELAEVNNALQADIIERKKAEEELKESEKSYRELTETLGAALEDIKKREQILLKGRDAFLNMLEDVSESYKELVIAYDSTIEGWSGALDYRDKETEGHSQRVTEITIEIARAAGIAEEELVHVRRGALLHDIGKLGVPDSILLKPGKLTEDEWVIMRKHPVIAYQLLSPIAFLRPALDIPYCHHENWDGTGYPQGLKAEQIPLAARIFALVDVWDALRSDRPYRPAWTVEKTRDYIASLKGIQFDPGLVGIFLKVISA